MEKIEVDLFTGQWNYAILKLPARRYPGILFQGDSFYSLCQTIESIRDKLNNKKSRKIINEDLNELLGELLELLFYYEDTLTKNNYDIPYVRKFKNK